MTDFSTLCVFLCTFIISFYFHKKLLRKNKKTFPPGPWGFPVVGHLPVIGRDPTKTFMRWQRKYGDIFRIRMGNWNTVVLNGYLTVIEAMTKGDGFSGRPSFETFKIFRKVLGDEVLSTSQVNPAYLQHRKLLTCSLRKITNSSMKLTQDLILHETNKTINQVLSRNGLPMIIEEEVDTLVGSIIHQILFGKEGNIRENESFKTVVEFTKETVRLARNGNPMNVLPWLKYVMPRTIAKVADNLEKLEMLRERLVKKRSEQLEDGLLTDITHMLLGTALPEHVNDKELYLSKKRLMVSLNEFYSAGLETTSTTLKWFVLYMIAYPEVQYSIQREIDDVVGRSDSIGMEHKPKLNYTLATIWEMMRITSIAPLSLHSVTMDTQLSGFVIEKDTVALVNLYSVHMDRSFWKDPESFRPDRLLNSNNGIIKGKVKHIIPFGMGRRRCAGENLAMMQVFLIFCTLMQRCSFSAVSDEEIDFEPILGITSSPKPYKVIIEQRT